MGRGSWGAIRWITAAIVKMTRTLAIIPVTLVLAFVRAKREGSGGRREPQEGFPDVRAVFCARIGDYNGMRFAGMAVGH